MRTLEMLEKPLIGKSLRAAAAALSIASISACAGGYSGAATDDGYGNPIQQKAKKAISAKDPRISGPIAIIDTPIGKVIGGGKDKLSLYTFAKDEGTVSNCYDSCAAAWPPFIAGNPALATDSLGVTGRKDGSLQWTFEGQPLYFWAGDTEQGQTTGANVPSWAVARP